MLAPICLFTYNRLEETIQTIEALKNCHLSDKSELFIFSDGFKNEEIKSKVDAVREYLHSVSGFKTVTIVESTENKGLANSIISGVSQIIKKYERVIVLEDDLITSPVFLSFINQALDYYKNDFNIQSVNGFALFLKNIESQNDIYFQKRPFSWGWATWSDRWDSNIFNKHNLKKEIGLNKSVLVKFRKECGDDIMRMFVNSINDKNDSWYVLWAFNHFQNNRYSVYPSYSLVENIGFGEAGTHCKNINPYNYKIDKRNKSDFTFIKFSIPKKRETKAFLYNFSFLHKVLLRIKLLGNGYGRKQLMSELRMKINKI